LSSSRNRIQITRAIAPTWWICGLWLLLAIIAQTTLAHYLRIRGVEPSLVLIAVVWYAIRVDSRHAAIFGLAAGLGEDIVAATSGGAWTLSTTFAAIVASLISRGFFADSLPLVAVITIVTTLARMLVFWIVMSIQGYPGGLGGMHFHEALFEAPYNAIAMIVVMLIARRFTDRYA
jgi:rod shape-determining protein MreD